MVDEWAPLAVLLGLSLIVLCIASDLLARVGAATVARRKASKDADEALANIAALDIEETAALAEALEDGVTRMSIEVGSVMWRVLEKGLLRIKRQQNLRYYICDIHPAIVSVKDEIIEQWQKDRREGRTPNPIDQGLGWMGR